MTIDAQKDQLLDWHVEDWTPEDGGGGSSGCLPAGFRRFEFSDDSSNKFWQIKLEGNSFHVHYGRIGTNGQSQSKDFPNQEKAQKEYDKLINEKLGKGYEEVESDDDGDEDSGDFDPANTIYRISISYEEAEEGLSWTERFNEYLNRPAAKKSIGIIVGSWSRMGEGDNSAEIAEALVNAAPQLPDLKAIFIADVTYEECEISWIVQSNLADIFVAYPRLEYFGVRGGNELRLGPINHEKLKYLVVETGGLPKTVLQEITTSKLPNLEHLELWLGTENYGADHSVDDLKPILFNDLFPKLSYLGLRNSEIADDIAEALKGAPIMNRIKILDLSLGTLSNQGGQALLDNPAIERLQELNLNHHYMSAEIMTGFGNLAVDVHLEDQEDLDPEDEDSRYVAVGE